MDFHRLDLMGQDLESFEGLSDKASEKFLLINVQRNKLVNFEFFGTHPYLSELQLQYNSFESFRGLTKQPALKSLKMHGCPLASHPYYRLMALLTVGRSLEVVDGLPITSQETKIAKTLGKHAALAVSYGWLLDLHPRTSEAYLALIDELRRLRKDERRQTQDVPRVTVGSVLFRLSQGLSTGGYVDAATQRELKEERQTITRLARRVAQLEGQLAGSTDSRAIPLLPLNTEGRCVTSSTGAAATAAFNASEFAQADTVCFSRGIQMRHNFSGPHSPLQRVRLQLDHATFAVEMFMGRERLLQLPLHSLRVRHLRPLTLVVEDEVGVAISLQFDTLALLHAVYRAIFVLSSRAVPPLSAITLKQLQEMDRATHESAPLISDGAPLAAERSPSLPVVSEVFSDADDEAAAKVKQRGSPTEELHHEMSPEPGKLDNVADVPPLPAAFSRNSTAGTSGSVVFSISDASKPPVPRDSAMKAVAQPGVAGNEDEEEMDDGTNIEFHSVAPSELGATVRSAAEAAKPAKRPAPPIKPPSKLFANLIVDSSASTDSVVFQTNDDHTDDDDSVVLEEEEQAKATPVPSAVRAAASTKPPAVPLAPRPAPAVPPRPPPSAGPSKTMRTMTGAAPPAAPPSRLSSTSRGQNVSLNSSMTVEKKSTAFGAGESSIRFRTDGSNDGAADAADNKAASSAAAPAPLKTSSTAKAPAPPPPKVPARFAALQLSSDSD